jgi:hypothetical protein
MRVTVELSPCILLPVSSFFPLLDLCEKVLLICGTNCSILLLIEIYKHLKMCFEVFVGWQNNVKIGYGLRKWLVVGLVRVARSVEFVRSYLDETETRISND